MADAFPRHDVPVGGRSGFTVIEDRQVHYLEWGRANLPDLLCLHGGGQTAYMYEDLGAALGNRYHLLAPDLPAHGDSEALGRRPTRYQVAETIPPLAAAFGIERAVFIGGSFGGIVSITLGATIPGLVAGIVLIDVGHELEEEGVRRIIDFMTAHESFGSLEEAAEAVRAYLPNRANVRAERLQRNLRKRDDGRWVWKHWISPDRRAEVTAGWRDVLAGLDDDARALRCPVLVLRGTTSDVLSEGGAENVAALIPDARIARVASAGHLAAGDNPESTVGLISSFLDEIGW